MPRAALLPLDDDDEASSREEAKVRAWALARDCRGDASRGLGREDLWTAKRPLPALPRDAAALAVEEEDKIILEASVRRGREDQGTQTERERRRKEWRSGRRRKEVAAAAAGGNSGLSDLAGEKCGERKPRVMRGKSSPAGTAESTGRSSLVRAVQKVAPGGQVLRI